MLDRVIQLDRVAMTRVVRQKPVEVQASDEELPALSTLLKGSTRNNAKDADCTARLDSTTTSPKRRSSPRRQGTAATNSARPGTREPTAVSNGLDLSRGISAIGLSASAITLPPPISPVKRISPAKSGPMKRNGRVDADEHLLPLKHSTGPAPDQERESGAATSMQQRQRSLKLAHVNSLLLPLSQVALGRAGVDEESDVEFIPSTRNDGDEKGDGRVRRAGTAGLTLSAIGEKESILKFDTRDVRDGTDRYAPRESPKRAAKEKAKCLSRFVFKEARCNDDFSDSSIDNDEDEEFTDLSGFVVDDDAELSFHGSDSDGNTDFDSRAERTGGKELSRKQVLQRRRNEARVRMESEDEDSIAGKENINVGDIAQDLFSLKLGRPTSEEQRGRGREIEVIDLTYSPPKAQPDLKAKSTTTKTKDVRSSGTNPFVSDDNDHLLKFSAPRFKHPGKIPPLSSNSNTSTESLASKPAGSKNNNKPCTTPPTTPPASPTKLKSPSKLHLLSPSKRGAAIPTSPHRQSIDAFWSSDVINTWNDQYSPRKPPLTPSPKKRGLSRLLDFNIWSDSDNEDADLSRDGKNDTSSSSDPPTPTRSPSPSTSPSKTAKSPSKLSSPSKKALTEAKKLFLSTRHDTAKSLLIHLDTHITSSQLSQLCASTGGVQILWSKNLRSTAGRANWRRTVTKPLNEPRDSLKSTTTAISSGSKSGTEGKPLVQHYASIELAEKVIDSDSRLVNTLAHEFCHLANFMVSGVRDQPHGASFKSWADKVTNHLRTASNLPSLYRAVEVTTKHSYVINHKYLWICAGTAPVGSAQAAARAFLALEDGTGCGAEYGRHSKSIDPKKHRCGKCKGLLVQVRPKPKPKAGKAEPDEQVESPKKGRRASPAKRRLGSDGGLCENEGAAVGRRDDKSNGLENALEDMNLIG